MKIVMTFYEQFGIWLIVIEEVSKKKYAVIRIYYEMGKDYIRNRKEEY